MWQQVLMRTPDHCCLSSGACSRVQADGAVLCPHLSRPFTGILVLHWASLLPSGAVSAPESTAGKARQQGLPLLGRFLQMQLCFARRQHMRSRAMSPFRKVTYVCRALKGGIQRQGSGVDRSPGWRTCSFEPRYHGFQVRHLRFSECEAHLHGQQTESEVRPEEVISPCSHLP